MSNAYFSNQLVKSKKSNNYTVETLGLCGTSCLQNFYKYLNVAIGNILKYVGCESNVLQWTTEAKLLCLMMVL